MSDYTSTQGPFIVRPLRTLDLEIGYLTVAQGETDLPIAIIPSKDGKPNYGDAAMLAAAPHMLDALIHIGELLSTSKETINLEELNAVISQVFEKIHAEADI